MNFLKFSSLVELVLDQESLFLSRVVSVGPGVIFSLGEIVLD